MNTSFDNVIVSVHTYTKSTKTKMNVLDSNPIYTNIYGHLQDTTLSPEGTTTGVAERDRPIRYRLIIHSRDGKKIKTGMVFKILKTRDPVTNLWVDLDEELYIDSVFTIVHKNLAISDQLFFVFGLIPGVKSE